MNEVTFAFKEIEKLENDSKYKVTIEFPLETGWIDYVNLIFETQNTSYSMPVKHLKNENGKIEEISSGDVSVRLTWKERILL